MDNENEIEMITVVFPLYQGCTLLDFAGASQVFGSANNMKVVWLAETLDPITTTEDVRVLPTTTFDKAPDEIDVLFVPGGGTKGVIDAMRNDALQKFIKKVSKSQYIKWQGSVCTGAFVMAVAGMFDECKATTYWSQLMNLDLFPNINVKTECYPRYFIDEQNGRFSGGGVSSSLDLALELLRRIKGETAAERTQLGIQYAPSPPLHTGDPSEAMEHDRCEIVEQVREKQQDKFITPIRQAVLSFLEENCSQ